MKEGDPTRWPHNRERKTLPRGVPPPSREERAFEDWRWHVMLGKSSCECSRLGRNDGRPWAHEQPSCTLEGICSRSLDASLRSLQRYRQQVKELKEREKAGTKLVGCVVSPFPIFALGIGWSHYCSHHDWRAFEDFLFQPTLVHFLLVLHSARKTRSI